MILESVNLKTRALRALFADHPEHLTAIERYHTDNAGMSRYDKFRHFYATMFHQPRPDHEMARLDRSFGELVAREIDTCAFVHGALAFIEARAAELRAIVEDRGLSEYFRGVFGSPRDKVALLTAIASNSGILPRDLILIGDGRQDYEAAAAVGARFIGRVAPGEVTAFPPGTAVVADLGELADRWESLRAPGA